ncbi:MAG: ThuA domain-containing protein [Pirellulaceae bacterium]|nr:ThuA domain-containing protein [Pirellulaceae bacterium]
MARLSGIWSRLVLFVILCWLPLVCWPNRQANAADTPFELTLRYRVPVQPNATRFHTLRRAERWQPAETAVIVCDMWDSHHSRNAVRRAEEMAPRMNQFLQSARQRGALIVHAPSGCMQPYEGHPARLRARAAPTAANLPPEIGRWCYRIPAEEQGVYPIDQGDGGEDDDPEELAKWHAELTALGRNPKAPWTRQMALLEIRDQDAISDNGVEIWNLMEQRGIRHVMLLGVHTNMCVLGRPFGLRQMARNGKSVVLVRDLTDTMYNPQRWPYVSHHSGTDLIVEHIEKHVCPTVTSDQLLGGQPFRFASDQRKHIALVMAEDEYETETTLTELARRHLQRNFRLSFYYEDAADHHRLPGIESLSEADLVVVSVRRRAFPKEQLDLFRRFVNDGKAVVGIRTASHAFALRSGPAPEGHDVWPEFDRDVLGGNYQGHHGNKAGEDPSNCVWAVPPGREHPAMRGFPQGEIPVRSWLYKTSPLAATTRTLMMGRVGDRQPHEPVTWTNVHTGGGRVFYTSLGHPEEFQMPMFRRLLVQGIYWAAGQEIPAELADSPPQPQN